MYLVEHNCKFALSPMLFESFDKAVAEMKIFLAMGYEVKLRGVVVKTDFKKESISK